MKKAKKRWIIAISAALCLLAMLIALGTCGGGKLNVEQAMPSFSGLPTEYVDDTYNAYPGLQAGPVTVIADTPWGILISCHISDHVMAQWYTLEDPKRYEVTKAEDAETRWFFLKPGESIKVLLDDRWRTDDSTFWTFTNVPETGADQS